MRRRSTLFLAALAGLAGCSAPEAAGPGAGPSGPPNASGGPVGAPGGSSGVPAGAGASGGPGVSGGSVAGSRGVGVLDGWPDRDPGLGSGFCFTLVQGLDSSQVIERLGGRELERVGWDLLVGPGDGEQADSGRFFIGVARIDDWALIVEDNGSLGVTRDVVGPLSESRRVLVYRSDAARRGRLLVFEDEDLVLDFASGSPERIAGSRPGDFVPAMRASGLTGGTEVTEPTASALRFLAGQTGVALTRDLLTERTYLLVTVPKP